jgi:hypothetical protein
MKKSMYLVGLSHLCVSRYHDARFGECKVFHYRFHSNLMLAPLISQIKPIPKLPSCFLNIYFNVSLQRILSSLQCTSGSPNRTSIKSPMYVWISQQYSYQVSNVRLDLLTVLLSNHQCTSGSPKSTPIKSPMYVWISQQYSYPQVFPPLSFNLCISLLPSTYHLLLLSST